MSSWYVASAHHQGQRFERRPVAFLNFLMKNKQTGLHADKPFSGDSLIESPIRVRSYIPYLMMMYRMCHTLIIMRITLSYDRLKYEQIMMRTLIALYMIIIL